MRELIYDHAGGIADGRELKAVIPGGSSVPALTPDQIDMPLDYDSLAAARHVLRRRVADRRRRPLLHGAARAALDEVLHARVVRQVHAVPRGNALDGAAPRADRGRRRGACPTSTCSTTSARGSSASRSARSATSRSTRCASYIEKWRDEFDAHIEQGGCPFDGESSLEGIVAPSDAAHATPGGARHERRPSWSRSRSTASRSRCRRAPASSRRRSRAGIEIPVFCYEPRLGPPVGACRMCLCEVAPGPPKPQAACTLTAADGMVVQDRAHLGDGRRGAERDARVHPRQPPARLPGLRQGRRVPAAGPDVPLRARATRGWRSRSARSRSRSRSRRRSRSTASAASSATAARASPSRSPRTASSSRVNRGALSMIATFEDEPYRAPFSGNVIELCPVGALTSTQYRFEARPWEIQNVPTVCGLCPVGCNISATTREGKVKRILSRNHPEVDEGWLCDKGRFAFAHLHADDRITDPLRADGARGFEALSWDDALDEAERLLRAAGPAIVTALSGTETVEQAYGLGEAAARRARRARRRAARGRAGRRSTPSARRSRRSATRPRSSSSATSRSSSARRSSTSGSRRPAATARTIADASCRTSRSPAACSSPTTPTAPPRYAHASGATAAFYLPRTPNGRGVADAWSAAADGEPTDVEPRLLIVSGDEAAADPAVRALAERAETVIGIGMFEGSFGGLCDLVLPGTSYLERDGTTVNLEGRLQRQRRAVIAAVPGRARLDLEARRALRRRDLAVRLDALRRGLGGLLRRHRLRRDRRAGRAAARRAEAPARGTGPPSDSVARAPGCGCSPTGRSSRARRSSGRPSSSSSGRSGEVELARADARARGIAAGDTVNVSSNGTTRRAARARSPPTSPPERCGSRSPTPATSTPSSR